MIEGCAGSAADHCVTGTSPKINTREALKYSLPQAWSSGAQASGGRAVQKYESSFWWQAVVDGLSFPGLWPTESSRSDSELKCQDMCMEGPLP